ncbi:hypothetical protein FHS92_003607, partial [Sphingobium subterraneum]|nr:hypothetical protein [Sphingobium subterraneum]
MRGALTHRLAGASRKALTAVLAASVVLAAPTPALAGVEGEMQNFMSDMGAQANVTGPSAYQAQSARSCDFGHLGEHVGNGLVVVDDRPCEER